MENRIHTGRRPGEMPVASSGNGIMPRACVGVLQYLGRSGGGSRVGDELMERQSVAREQ